MLEFTHSELAMNNDRKFRISHDVAEESFLAKARWFHGLSVNERLDVYESMMDFVRAANPNVGRNRHVVPIQGPVRVVKLP